MIVPVLWKSYNPDTPARGYWDQGMLEDLFSGFLWKVPGVEYEVMESADFGVVVLPARSNGDYVEELNKDLAKMGAVVLMLTGDEENVFPIEKVQHPNIKIYVMSPREDLDRSKYRVLGTGYPGHIHKFIDNMSAPEKKIDWFFAGQVTHGRREECAEQLREVPNGKLVETQGFTQGLSPEDYYGDLMSAVVAPCPSGPETPDTFRLFEALEVGCIPIADTLVSKGGFTNNYWPFFFGEQPPFPIIEDYSDMHGYIVDNIDRAKANKVYAWWQAKKREFAYTVANDILDLCGEEYDLSTKDDMITVIIPSSPIKSNPSTEIIDETIGTIREHLPLAEIIITLDGVRDEQEYKRSDYEEFIRRLLWKCNNEYKNVFVILFDEHTHQVGMAREAFRYVNTPFIVYAEQDTPLTPDMDIEWDNILKDLLSGVTNMVRFHFEARIPTEHQHMVHGTEESSATPLMRTSQWSQRPHIASKAFYDRILSSHFTTDAKSFIEDKMHGVLHEAYRNYGVLGWEQFRVHIYYPEGNIKRSYHTDGRAGGEKYDDTQVF